MPLYTDGESMPAWDISYNAQSNALATALDDADAADHAADAVEAVDDLPVTGNWLGRLIWVAEDDRVRRWNGSQWGVIGFPPSIQTSPTVGSGWDTPSINFIYQRSGWVQATFNAYRSSGAAVGAVLFDVPVGYQGDHNVFAVGGKLNGSGVPLSGDVWVYYDVFTEEVKLRTAMAADTSIAVTIGWPLEGAS